MQRDPHTVHFKTRRTLLCRITLKISPALYLIFPLTSFQSYFIRFIIIQISLAWHKVSAVLFLKLSGRRRSKEVPDCDQDTFYQISSQLRSPDVCSAGKRWPWCPYTDHWQGDTPTVRFISDSTCTAWRGNILHQTHIQFILFKTTLQSRGRSSVCS